MNIVWTLSQIREEVQLLVLLFIVKTLFLNTHNILQFYIHICIHIFKVSRKPHIFHRYINKWQIYCSKILIRLLYLDEGNLKFNEPSLPDRILRTKEVQDITGLSRTTIWRMERKGDFPARVMLGENSIGWRYVEVDAWIKNRKAK